MSKTCVTCGNRVGDPMAVGSIVQVAPSVEMFGGCFAVINEVHLWGVLGYTQVAGQSGQAWLKLSWEQFQLTGGEAVWVIGEDAPDDQ